MGLVCLPTYKTHGCYGLQQCWRSNWILGWSCGIRFWSWDSLKSTYFLWCFKKTVKVFRFFVGIPKLTSKCLLIRHPAGKKKQRFASWQRVVNRIQDFVANRESQLSQFVSEMFFRCIANFRTSLLRLDLTWGPGLHVGEEEWVSETLRRKKQKVSHGDPGMIWKSSFLESRKSALFLRQPCCWVLGVSSCLKKIGHKRRSRNTKKKLEADYTPEN